MMFRILALILFFTWGIYWQIGQYKAYKEKPLSFHQPKLFNILGRVGIRVIFALVFIQLVGISLLPMHAHAQTYQLVGFIFVLIGMVISISARVVLSSNWSNGYEYQIKKGQELITHGIYKFIRHPIYSGMVISFIGAEMVAGSWLWVSFLALFLGAYVQGKREEKILLAHFGNQYKEYMTKSKMIIPFVF